ncbi:MAG: glycoside hydrolase family 3 protein [Spirochaetia bacterium]|nr:glycoside hydrolase family 3 protein [Spirochaetia bacterium]
MSDEELAGQLFMISYPSTEPDETAIKWIEERNLGGIKIFGKNAGSLPKLAENIGFMQEKAGQTRLRIPLLIATDQEGGWVRHIKFETSETAGNMSLGASGIASDSLMSSLYINRQLKVLGINMNFAPTVDIYSNPNNIVIGPRAFSADPVQTAELAKAWHQGAEEAGIIATAKHFPGHGRTDKDSHGTLPVIKATLEEIEESDLIPFKALIEEKVPAVMAGHLAFPLITGSNRPATISQVLLKRVLRDSLGFQGLIITDDMIMAGASSYTPSTAYACLESIKSGADMVLVSTDADTFELAHQLIVQEIRKDPDFRHQVQESVLRILAVKMRYLKPDGEKALIPDVENVRRFFPDREAEGFFYRQCCRSVSFVRDADEEYISLEGKKVLFVGPRYFLSEALRRYPKSGTYQTVPYFYDTDDWHPYELGHLIPKYDKVVFCVAGPAHAQMLSRLSIFKENIVVFSLLSPAFINDITWARGIAVYGRNSSSIAAGLAAMAGDFIPSGKVPIPLKEEAQ